MARCLRGITEFLNGHLIDKTTQVLKPPNADVDGPKDIQILTKLVVGPPIEE